MQNKHIEGQNILSRGVPNHRAKTYLSALIPIYLVKCQIMRRKVKSSREYLKSRVNQMHKPTIHIHYWLLGRNYGALEGKVCSVQFISFNYYYFGRVAVKKVEKKKLFLSRFFLVLLDFVSIFYQQASWSSH